MNKIKLSRRLGALPSQAFEFFDKAKKREASGADIIHLEFGTSSFDTPSNIKEAAKRALDEGRVHYDELSGVQEFRNALAIKLERDNCLKVDPDSQILVTSALTQGSFAALMALIDEEDEVINFNPGYHVHDRRVLFAGGMVRHVALRKEDGYHLNVEDLEKAVTPRTKVILWVNLLNPVGRVFNEGELGAMAEVAKKYDLMVLSDETYEYVTYDGQHMSIATLPGMTERTVTLFTFTKAYAMDGWRLGYAVGPPNLIAAMKQITVAVHTHVNVFIQWGGIEAVLGSQKPIQEMVEEDRRRRDLAVERLNKMQQVKCHSPQGAIYVFPDFSAYNMESEDLAEFLLETANVATAPGTEFGSEGKGHLRMCFGGVTYERLSEGFDRIENILPQLASRND